MNSEFTAHLRMKCIQEAVRSGAQHDDIVGLAEKLAAFVLNENVNKTRETAPEHKPEAAA